MMSWLTTTKDAPTLREKFRKARRAKAIDKHKAKGGAICIGCGGPISASSSRSNVHPRCVTKVVSGWE
jgi:hypothetical protein